MKTSNNQSPLSKFRKPDFCVCKWSKFATLASGSVKLGKPWKYRAKYCNATPGKPNLIWKLQICTTESRNTEIHQENLITKTLMRVTSYWPNTEKSLTQHGEQFDLTQRRPVVWMAILIRGHYIHTVAGCFLLIPVLLWDDNKFWVKLNWEQIKLGMMNMPPIHSLCDSGSLWHVTLQFNVNAASNPFSRSTEHNSDWSLIVYGHHVW